MGSTKVIGQLHYLLFIINSQPRVLERKCIMVCRRVVHWTVIWDQ